MERSRDWMEQAQWDLLHAKGDIEQKFYDWACFSAQQAAEKAVKAALPKIGIEAWGYSVADLLEELMFHPAPVELKEAAFELDKAYIPARYPDAHPTGSPSRRYTKKEAERLVSDAGQILLFCQDILSSL